MLVSTNQKNMSKPHIHLGALGHKDHGRTSLTAAILASTLATTHEPIERGITIKTQSTEYKPEQTRVKCSVCKGFYVEVLPNEPSNVCDECCKFADEEFSD